MKSKLFIVLIGFIFIQCSNLPKGVKSTLKSAGSNKNELLKVIDHFKKEKNKEKLLSAYFLIANMEGKVSESYFNIVPVYENVLDSVNSDCNKNLSYKTLNEKVGEWKEFSIKKNNLSLDLVRYNKDLHNLDAEYLINNVNLAYGAWKKYPWAKHVTFEDYCEYILPYKLFNEPVQDWRKKYRDYFQTYIDSVGNSDDPVELARLINNRVNRDFKFFSNFTLPHIGASDQLETPIGYCEHRYLVVAMALRSLGVPVRLEYCPQWSRWPGNHFWLAILCKNGKIMSFNGGEPFAVNDDNQIPVGGHQYVTKVYQITYANQKSNRPYIKFQIFDKNNFVDVTNQYSFGQRDLSISLKKQKESLNGQYVYLCAYSYGQDVSPVAYSIVKNNKAEFNCIGRDAIYYIASINAENVIPVSQPFEVVKDVDTLRNFKPKKDYINVKVYTKFSYADSMYNFAQDMIGSKFQACNSKSFLNPYELYTITEAPEAYMEKQSNPDKKFRYLRYLSCDSGMFRMAEISFYGKNLPDNVERKLSGKIISSLSFYNNSEINNIFDNNIATNLNGPGGSWVGIDLGANNNVLVSKVKYLPRNTLNIVSPGDVCELFYFDYGWVSLGKQQASDFFLEYKVPQSALFLLHNQSRGKEERIFIFDEWKNYKQIFY